MDITVSLQFHNEGWLAHPTLRALHRVVLHAEQHGKRVEVVATLDRTRDEALRRIVGQWSRRFPAFEVHEVDVGDPSLCRNLVVQRARGRFVAPHDGDNLYGEDWLTQAHDRLLQRPRAIAHPELIWIFQGRSQYWAQAPLGATSEILFTNPWDTVCLAAREVFEEVPYRAATRAYAYEDWAWNCDTIAAGLEHVFVARTIVAKRQRSYEESNEGAWLRSGKTLPPTPLIASLLRTPGAHRPTSPPGSGRGQEAEGAVSVRRRYRKTKESFKRRYPVLFRRLLGMKYRIFGQPPSTLVPAPEWAVRELDRLRLLEPALGDYRRIEGSPIRRPDLGRWVTPEMARLLDAERPAVVLLSQLRRGDVDLEALRSLHALEGPLFVILTGTGKTRWKGVVPANCTVIDLTVMDVVRPLKLAFLHRLLLEIRPRWMHNLDSTEAYELFCAHPASFEGVRKWATVPGVPTGPTSASVILLRYLPRLLGFFDGITTDSEASRQSLIELFGLPQERVVAFRTWKG